MSFKLLIHKQMLSFILSDSTIDIRYDLEPKVASQIDNISPPSIFEAISPARNPRGGFLFTRLFTWESGSQI